MVLEEATAPSSTETFRNDSPPNSNSDPYNPSSSSPAAVSADTDMGQRFPDVFPSGYRIPVDQLPSAIPLFGPLFGFTKPLQLQLIVNSASSVAQSIRRPLTDTESNAVAWHAAKAFTIASYGSPIGISGSLIRWWTTQDKMRFPFYQPDLEKYKFQRFGPLQGRHAYKFWQSLRLASYGLLGHWVGKAFFTTYGVTIMATGQRLDNRLKDVMEAQRKRAPRVRPRTAQDTTQEAQGGDMSTDSHGNYGAGSQNDSQNPSSSRPAAWQQQIADYSGRVVASKSSVLQTKEPPANGAAFEFDDASPTAGNEPVDLDLGPGSAWDKLREGALPSNQSSQSTSSSSPGDGDAWARMRDANSVGQDQRSNSESDEMFDDDKKWK